MHTSSRGDCSGAHNCCEHGRLRAASVKYNINTLAEFAAQGRACTLDFRRGVENVELRKVRVDHDEALEAL